MSKTEETRDEIRRLYKSSGILTIDPDAHAPGAAFWLPCSEKREAASCWVWGGNKTGEALAYPILASDILEHLTMRAGVGLVIVEAAKSGRDSSHRMAQQNIVRGGWVWTAAIQDRKVLLVDPKIWQGSNHGWGLRGKGAYKTAYKARAREVVGRAVNEDAAAALGMLEFALGALGNELPKQVTLAPPSLLR